MAMARSTAWISPRYSRTGVLARAAISSASVTPTPMVASMERTSPPCSPTGGSASRRRTASRALRSGSMQPRSRALPTAPWSTSGPTARGAGETPSVRWARRPTSRTRSTACRPCASPSKKPHSTLRASRTSARSSGWSGATQWLQAATTSCSATTPATTSTGTRPRSGIPSTRARWCAMVRRRSWGAPSMEPRWSFPPRRTR
jgi:hypothetical protein